MLSPRRVLSLAYTSRCHAGELMVFHFLQMRARRFHGRERGSDIVADVSIRKCSRG